MHVTDLLRILRTRWPVIAIATLLAVVPAWILLPDKLPQSGASNTFAATSTLVVQAPTSSASGGKIDPTQLSTLSVVASQGEVPVQAANDLNTTVGALLARIQVTSSAPTNSVSIVARDRTSTGAARTAETYSRRLVILLTAQAQQAQAASRDALAQQVGQLTELEAALTAKALTDPTAKAEADAVARQLNSQRTKLTQVMGDPPAGAPLRSVGPPAVQRVVQARSADRLLRLPVRLGLAALLGLGGSVGALLLLSRFDLRLRTKQAAELAYGLPVLAEIPGLSRNERGAIALTTRPQGAHAESHRILRTALVVEPAAEAHQHAGRPHVVVVTSADPAEGKTATAANLAASFAEAGQATLLVGLDLRLDDLPSFVTRGLATQEIDIPGDPYDGTTVRVRVAATGIRHLRLVMPVSPFGPPAIVLPVVAGWLRTAGPGIDVVVIDTPPLLLCNDASEVVPFADSVLVACRAGQTTAATAERAAEVLRRLRAPGAGVVLVGATLRAAVRKVEDYGVSGWTPPRMPTHDPREDDLLQGLRHAGLPRARVPEVPIAAPVEEEDARPTDDGQPPSPGPPVYAPDPDGETPWPPPDGPSRGVVQVARSSLGRVAGLRNPRR